MLVRPVRRDSRPWNKSLLIVQKKPLKPKHVWSIRVHLEISRSWRDLSSLTWPSTASFAPANFDWTTFAQEQRCDIEQRSFKKRQIDQSSSRSRSSRGAPLKPGFQCSGPLVPDISSQVDFMQGPTYPLANMRGWCIGGLK